MLADLQKEGLLNINDPITKFLPEFAGNPKLEKITLFHHATHTSGLPNHPLRITMLSLASILFPNRGPPHGAWYNFSKSDLFSYISKTKLSKLGEKWSYSNSGYGLLGQIFERLTNSSYEELINSRICKPLGMKDTGINLFESHKSSLAVGHSKHGKKIDPSISPSLESAAGLRSTMNDMIKFLNASLNLNQSSINPTLKYCQSTRIGANLSLVHRILLRSWLHLGIDEMALGWFVMRLENNTEVLYHSGGTPGFTSFIGMIPKDNVGVVLLCNQLFPTLPKLGIDVLRMDNHSTK